MEQFVLNEKPHPSEEYRKSMGSELEPTTL